MNEVKAQYDGPWKEGITAYFEQFLEFCFPDIHREIDWSRRYNVLEQQLQEIVNEAESENLYADKLFQVWLLSGTELWVLIHIEIQSQRDVNFAQRMYQYNYRAFDRYETPIISVALLGDDSPSWRPSFYSYGLDGCQMRFDFPIVKLLDYRENWAALAANMSLVALMIMGHLKTKETTHNLEERQRWKSILVRSLLERGYTREDIILLFRILDKMMALSESLQQGFKQDLQSYVEERKMPFLSTIEEEAMATGIQKGIQQGLQQGRIAEKLENTRDNLANILLIRFGELPEKITASLSNIADVAVLQRLLTQAVTVNSLAEFSKLLP